MFAKIVKKSSVASVSDAAKEPEIIEIDIDSSEKENLPTTEKENTPVKSPVKKNKTPTKPKTPTQKKTPKTAKTPTQKKTPTKAKTPIQKGSPSKAKTPTLTIVSTKVKTPTKTPKTPLSAKATPENRTKKDKTDAKSKSSAKKVGKENAKQISEKTETKTPKSTPTQKKGKFTPDNKQRSLSDFFKATPK